MLLRILRWGVSALYALGLVLIIHATGPTGVGPTAILAITGAYGILMSLLWLYGRYPPQPAK